MSISKLINVINIDLEKYLPVAEKKRPSISGKWKVIMKSSGFMAVAVFRYGFWVNNEIKWGKKNVIWLFAKIVFHLANYLTRIGTKIMIEERSIIGSGLSLSNKGNIILGVKAMGSNCTVKQKVTIGMGEDQIPPTIGDNVYIGSNSVVFGNIKIGNNVIIHDGTIVSKNIYDNCEVSGNPGRIKKVV